MTTATGSEETSVTRRRYAPRMPVAQRREQLLDAALDIALERGFHAVTVDAVARACGVTRPVVYGVFADRTALLTALADRAEARTLEQLAPVFPSLDDLKDDTDPDELLVAGVTAYLSAVAADPRTWRVVLLPPEGAPAEIAERVDRHRRVLLRQLRLLLDWGLTRRGGPALDPDLFARAVFTLAEGAARLLLADPDRWQVESFTAFARTALGALRPAG
ncbi:MAG: TetR/AcrR family transcriptional regulator [Actinomycetes bacterium]